MPAKKPTIKPSKTKSPVAKNIAAKKPAAKKPAKTIAGKNPAAKKRRPKGESIAVFIDLDNTNISRDNMLELFSILQTKGDIIYGKIYGYTDDKSATFEEIIAEYRLETVGKLRFKTDGVSCVDTRMVVDILDLNTRYKYDMVFVWAGVGDMIPIFSRLKELKCKVLTVDNEEFDSSNKFVDQKIKLFSPHTSIKSGSLRYSQTKQVNHIIPPAVSKPVDEIFAGRPVPQLPRKKGAPEFGTQAKQYNPNEEGDGVSEVDNANLLRFAQDMIREMQETREEANRPKTDYVADFGDLEFIDDAGRTQRLANAKESDKLIREEKLDRETEEELDAAEIPQSMFVRKGSKKRKKENKSLPEPISPAQPHGRQITSYKEMFANIDMGPVAIDESRGASKSKDPAENYDSGMYNVEEEKEDAPPTEDPNSEFNQF